MNFLIFLIIEITAAAPVVEQGVALAQPRVQHELESALEDVAGKEVVLLEAYRIVRVVVREVDALEAVEGVAVGAAPHRKKLIGELPHVAAHAGDIDARLLLSARAADTTRLGSGELRCAWRGRGWMCQGGSPVSALE